MEVAVISPVYDLDLSDNLSHLYMALQWLCKKDPQYRSHWKNIKTKFPSSYVILDNGANEAQLCDDLELLGTAVDINADEIVAPDVFDDAEGTMSKTEIFLGNYFEKYIEGNFNVMAVAQGRNQVQFMDCYKEFVIDPRISTIGIGYRNLFKPFEFNMRPLTEESWKALGIPDTRVLKDMLDEQTFYFTVSRLFFLRTRVDFKDLRKHNKQIHLLGLTNPYELSLYKKVLYPEELELIRGCDSASPCQAAQAGVKFNKGFGVEKKPKDYLDFEKRMTSKQRELAIKNMVIIEKWME